MKDNYYNLQPDTSKLIEALRDVLRAENKVLSAYLLTYGDTIPGDGTKTSGEREFQKSGFYESFSSLKGLLRLRIGETIEEDLDNNSKERR